MTRDQEDTMSELTKTEAIVGPGERDAGVRFKHRVRGTSYTVLGHAVLQTNQPVSDQQELVVYAGADGRLWVRPVTEFYDGRFERLEGS
jgi:hypothetical protein